MTCYASKLVTETEQSLLHNLTVIVTRLRLEDGASVPPYLQKYMRQTIILMKLSRKGRWKNSAAPAGLSISFQE